MRLTKRKIESLEYDEDGPSQQIVWDDRLQNFGVRLYESGTKSFVIRYRNEHGRRRYMTIGKFGRMTLQQARSAALEKFVEVDGGADPVADEKRADADTVEALVDAFVEKHAKQRRSTWETDKSRLERYVADRWKGRPPGSLTRADLADLHREIGEEHPVEANRVIETVHTMLEFAAREGIVEDGFNPAKYVEKFPEPSRDRWLRPHEIPAFAQAVDAIDNVYMRHYFWLLLLTATRRNEMLEARWSHVDFEQAELFLPDTKNGTDHIVPLSQPALRLFEETPRQKGNPWVFCSHIKGQRLKSVNGRWRRTRREAGLDDVTLHDFRRTAATWIAQSGYSELVIKKFLNHTLHGVTSVYARMQPGAVREAVEDYGRKIMAAKAGGDTDVISLTAAKGKG